MCRPAHTPQTAGSRIRSLIDLHRVTILRLLGSIILFPYTFSLRGAYKLKQNLHSNFLKMYAIAAPRSHRPSTGSINKLHHGLLRTRCAFVSSLRHVLYILQPPRPVWWYNTDATVFWNVTTQGLVDGIIFYKAAVLILNVLRIQCLTALTFLSLFSTPEFAVGMFCITCLGIATMMLVCYKRCCSDSNTQSAPRKFNQLAYNDM